VVVLVVAPDELKLTFLLASALSTNVTEVLFNDLLVNVSVVALPINVSVASGNVKVLLAV